MICKTVHLGFKSGGDPIQIVALSDLHFGHVNCDIDAIKAAVKRKNAYFIIMGDIHDAIVVSDRRYAKGEDASHGDAILDEQYDQALSALWPVRKRLLWVLRGNHDDTVIRRSGTDLVDRLCRELSSKDHDVLYAGYSCLIKLVLRSENAAATVKNALSRTVVFRCHHGWGGGCRTIGSVITKYSHDVKYWDADVFIYGHDHVLHSVPVPRGTCIGNKLVAKNKHIVLAGTYLRTYTRDTVASWHERKGFPLAKIGSPTINIRPTHRGWAHVWIDT